MRLKTKNTPDENGVMPDPDLLMFKCLSCGIPIAGYSLFHKFKNNKEAMEYFKYAAEQTKLNLPRMNKSEGIRTSSMPAASTPLTD